MNKKIISVRIEYSTSLGKWKGIREFAELNEIDTTNIDAMIARIVKVGDADMDETSTFEISSFDDLYDSIFSSFKHVCPHCEIYFECRGCPLDDDSIGCCREWCAIKKQMINYL